MKMIVKCGIVLLTLAKSYISSPLIRFSSDIDKRVIGDGINGRSTKGIVNDLFIAVKTTGKSTSPVCPQS